MNTHCLPPPCRGGIARLTLGACLLLLAPLMHSMTIGYDGNMPLTSLPTDLQTAIGNGDQPMAQYGYLDVTKEPFNAAGDGSTDDTSAIQKAVDYAYFTNYVVYFPLGTYLLSARLDMRQEQPASGQAGQAKFANKLRGEIGAGNARPVLKLVDHSTLDSEALLDFYYVNCAETRDASRQYGAELKNFEIDMGDNEDFSAIRMDGAQYCAIENIKVHGTNFDSGIRQLPGSGGSVRDIEIVGGKYGIYQNAIRPSPTVVGFVASGQSEAAVRSTGCRSLTLVGFNIAGRIMNEDINPDTILRSRGNLNLIEGVIDYAAGTAIENWRADLYIKRVHIRGTNLVVSGSSAANGNDCHTLVSPDNTKFYRIDEYAYANDLDKAHLSINGASVNHLTTSPVSAKLYLGTVVNSYVSPNTYVTKHLERTFPGPQDAFVDIVNDYGATRDIDSDDDAAAIQAALNATLNPLNSNYGKVVLIPRGIFHVSSTISVPAGAKLRGAGNNISVIQAHKDWKPTSTTPILATASGTSGAAIYLNDFAILRVLPHGDPKETNPEGRKYISYLDVEYYKTFYKDVLLSTVDYGASYDDYWSHATPVTFGASAGGKFYNLVTTTGFDNIPTASDGAREYAGNSDIAHVRFESTQPLIVYHSSIEHGNAGHGDRYIKNAQNLWLLGVKHESEYKIAKIENSSDIFICGGSGNFIIYPGRAAASLIEITGSSTNIAIATMARKIGRTEPSGYNFLTDTSVSLPSTEDIAYYRIGSISSTLPTITP